MINIFNIEDKLGLKYYQGGAGSGQGSGTPQMTPDQLAQIYGQSLPSMLQTTVNQTPYTTAVQGLSAAAANPIYTASGLDQLNSLAPGYQAAGANLSASQAASQAALLNGPGSNVASAANALNNTYNPAQAAANGQATNLVNSINLNGLSGGEQAAVERSLGQSNYATGNLGIDNATNAVSNAMQFGNALQAKRAALGSALGTASTVSGAQNTSFNPVNTAFNAGSTGTNFGLGTFNPTQANGTTGSALSFGSSVGNQLAGLGAASKTQNGNSNFNLGCYLTTACCEYKGLPDNCEQLTILRKFRDEFVPKFLVKEYYELSPLIEPRVRKDYAALTYVWVIVNQCCSDIKKGLLESALNRYTNMVTQLKEIYGIN